jgi:hypothetical protein
VACAHSPELARLPDAASARASGLGDADGPSSREASRRLACSLNVSAAKGQGAGQVVGEAGPGLWVRVKRVLLPNGEEMPLPEEPVYLLRWELVTTARLYDALPADVRRIG